MKMNNMPVRKLTTLTTGTLINSLLVIGAGIGVGITITLLAVIYLPGFCPGAFERIQRTGLAPVVPLVAIIQLSASVGWLYVRCTEKNGDDHG